MKKARIAAVMVTCFITFTIYPPQIGHSQFKQDSVLNLQNQMLLKTYRDMLDSMKAINQRTVSKLNKLEVRKCPDKTILVVHDTVYLPFWKSLFHIKTKR